MTNKGCIYTITSTREGVLSGKGKNAMWPPVMQHYYIDKEEMLRSDWLVPTHGSQ